MRFRRTSGRFAALSALLTGALAAGGCYGFSGGGGFPSHIRTVYIEPFDNRTDRFDVDQLLFRQLTENLPRSLGVRLGPQQTADAVVRGSISRYEDAARSYLPGQASGGIEVLQHQVQITISVEIIDVTRNLILWDSQALTGRGEYRPDSQSDEIARTRAIESIIRQIIDGAQSQW
jgi:hypothetical protein